MIPTSDLPDLLGAVTALLAAVSGLCMVLFVQARKARAEARFQDAETKKILAQIEAKTVATAEQVKNNHGTNLRDDLDRLADKVAMLFTKLDNQADKQDRQFEVLHRSLAGMSDRLERLDSDSHDTHADLYTRLRRLETFKRPHKRQSKTTTT